jgi:hypothetical protein
MYVDENIDTKPPPSLLVFRVISISRRSWAEVPRARSVAVSHRRRERCFSDLLFQIFTYACPCLSIVDNTLHILVEVLQLLGPLSLDAGVVPNIPGEQFELS